MLLFIYTAISLVFIWFISKSKIEIPLALTVVIAFFLRLFVTVFFLTSQSADLHSFLVDGQNLLERNSNYQVDYFPFISHLSLLAIQFRSYLHPYLFLKLVFTLFDVAILFPLYFLSQKNLQSVLIYALNPISIIVTNIHGQMESIPLFFMLFGLLLFLHKKTLASVLTLSYGIYTKQWPILFLIPLIRKLRNKFLFIGLAFVPLIFTIIHSIFFPNSLLDIFTRVKNYRGVFGAWGLSKLAIYFANSKLNPIYEQWTRRIFLISFFSFSFLWQEKNLIRNILTIMLFLFVFTPTFGIQWLTWLVPFIILVRPKLWRSFIFFTSIYIAFGFAWDAYQYFRDIMPIWNSVVNTVGFLLWILIIVMFFQNVFFKTSKGQKNSWEKSNT